MGQVLSANVRPDAPLDISSLQSVLEKGRERFRRQARARLHGQAHVLRGARRAREPRRGRIPEARRQARRARRALPAEHASLRDRLLRRPEGGRRRWSTTRRSTRCTTLEFKVDDSETDILVTLDLASLYPQAEKLLATTRLKTLVVGEFAEMRAAPDAVKAHMTAAGMLAEVKPERAASPSTTCSTTTGASSPVRSAHPTDAVAVLAYTGGTTGSPKGAMLTHANLTAACSLYAEVMTRSEQGLRVGEERFLCILPLFHIYSLTVVMLLGFRLGRGARAPSALRSRSSASRTSSKRRSPSTWACRRCMSRILSLPDVEKHGFLVAALLRLRRGAASGRGAGAVRERRSAARLIEGWGMTETSPHRHLHAARMRRRGRAPAAFPIPART